MLKMRRKLPPTLKIKLLCFLPQTIAPNTHPSRYLLFLYHLPVKLKIDTLDNNGKAEVESHWAKLISDDS